MASSPGENLPGPSVTAALGEAALAGDEDKVGEIVDSIRAGQAPGQK